MELTDSLLSEGVEHLGERFRSQLLSYLRLQQRPEGGFSAPAGTTADLYYSDFGVRLLWLLRARREAIERVTLWAEHESPSSLVEWFNLYNIQRLARTAGIEMAIIPPVSIPQACGAYDLFLSMLLDSMRGQVTPSPLQALLQLGRADGGFSESVQGKESQTNATAAAISILRLCEGQPERIELGCDYLVAQQRPEGGFSACPGAPADLLSTFSSLLALALMGHVDRVNLPLAGVFLRSCARGDGGFAASARPAYSSDVEYTYYGVATAALLRRLTI